jgi:hypothetical protein
MTKDLVFRMKIDSSGFRRGVWDMQTAMGNLPLAVQGRPVKPRRPYPRDISRMTARQYRAERRRYGRQMRAWRKADRDARARHGGWPNPAAIAILKRVMNPSGGAAV